MAETQLPSNQIKDGGIITDDLANNAATYAKMQDVSATDKVLGRSTAGAGDIEEIACTAAGRAILDDTDAATQRNTLGLETVGQAEAEAGTGTTERAFTAQRVKQAIEKLSKKIIGKWFDFDAKSPVTEVTSGNVLTFELKDTFDRSIDGSIYLDQNIDLSTNPVLRIHLVPTTTGAGNANVRLKLIAWYLAETEATTKAADETLTQNFPIIDTLNQVHACSFTLDGSKMAGNDRVSFNLERTGTDGVNDTYTGDIGIVESARLDILH